MTSWFLVGIYVTPPPFFSKIITERKFYESSYAVILEAPLRKVIRAFNPSKILATLAAVCLFW